MFFLIILHLLVTGTLIFTILLQKGENAGMMGSSSGQGLFTAKGTANVLTHITAALGTVFFLNCILMVYISTHKMKAEQKILQQIERQNIVGDQK